MKLKEKIIVLIRKVYQTLRAVDWRGVGKKIINRIGAIMHHIIFSWLLPEKYRNISKKELFEIIFKSDTPAGKRFDIWLLILIVANIVLLIVDSLTGATTTMTNRAQLSFTYILFKVLEWGFTLFFTFEYYLRIYCLKHPWKYVLSFWGIIDFISIFPAYLSLLIPATQALTVLRLLRVMRIFRIFNLSRFQTEFFHLLSALKASSVKILVFMLFILVASIILGTMMFSFESEKNPAFGNILSGIYWAVVTITTVGYGDIAPVTAGGRFLSVLVMLLGYSIIAVPTGIVAGEVAAEYKKPRGKDRRSAVQRDYDDEEEAIRN